MKEATIKRIKPAFEDKRGKILDILDDEKIMHIGLITSKAGAVRGNHYHNKTKQFNYIISGRAEFITKSLDDKKGEIKRYILEKGDFVSIPPMVIHTIKALEDLEFIDLNTLSRSDDGYEKDVVRVEIEKP